MSLAIARRYRKRSPLSSDLTTARVDWMSNAPITDPAPDRGAGAVALCEVRAGQFECAPPPDRPPDWTSDERIAER